MNSRAQKQQKSEKSEKKYWNEASKVSAQSWQLNKKKYRFATHGANVCFRFTHAIQHNWLLRDGSVSMTFECNSVQKLVSDCRKNAPGKKKNKNADSNNYWVSLPLFELFCYIKLLYGSTLYSSSKVQRERTNENIYLEFFAINLCVLLSSISRIILRLVRTLSNTGDNLHNSHPFSL